jgi:hypothetical protein
VLSGAGVFNYATVVPVSVRVLRVHLRGVILVVLAVLIEDIGRQSAEGPEVVQAELRKLGARCRVGENFMSSQQLV